MGSLTRTPHGEYPEYHTSGDNPDLVLPDGSWTRCDATSRCSRSSRGTSPTSTCPRRASRSSGKRGLYGRRRGQPRRGQPDGAALGAEPLRRFPLPPRCGGAVEAALLGGASGGARARSRRAARPCAGTGAGDMNASLAGRSPLVTGASGFIGGAMARRLSEAGAIVHGVSAARAGRGRRLRSLVAGGRHRHRGRPSRPRRRAAGRSSSTWPGSPSGARELETVLPMLQMNLLAASTSWSPPRNDRSRASCSADRSKSSTRSRPGRALVALRGGEAGRRRLPAHVSRALRHAGGLASAVHGVRAGSADLRKLVPTSRSRSSAGRHRLCRAARGRSTGSTSTMSWMRSWPRRSPRA